MIRFLTWMADLFFSRDRETVEKEIGKMHTINVPDGEGGTVEFVTQIEKSASEDKED